MKRMSLFLQNCRPKKEIAVNMIQISSALQIFISENNSTWSDEMISLLCEMNRKHKELIEQGADSFLHDFSGLKIPRDYQYIKVEKSMQSIEYNRKENLDFLKAFCIFLVVLGHVSECFIQNDMFMECYSFNNMLYSIIYSFHMPLMFVVSGYVASMKQVVYEKNAKAYLNKTVVAYYVPYLIFNTLFVLGKIFVFKGSSGVNIENLYFTAILPSGVFWFLWALLIIRIISFLLHMYIKGKWLIAGFAIIVALIGNAVSVEFFALNRIMQLWICYEIGYILFDIEKRLKDIQLRMIAIFGLLISVIALCTLGEDIDSYFGKIIIGTGLSIFLIIATDKMHVKNSFISLIGRETMVIYLLHSFMTGPINSVINVIYSGGGYMSRLLLQTSILLFFPLGVVLLYKKIKIFSWIEYFFYPNKIKSR